MENSVVAQGNRMLMPRFTIRAAFVGVTLCAVVFLVVGFGFRGDNSAWAFTIGLISLLVTALVHAAWFAVVWLFAQLPAAQPVAPNMPPGSGGIERRSAVIPPLMNSENRGEANV